MNRQWTRDDSVVSHEKYESKAVMSFMTDRFNYTEDIYDFEDSNSFWFATILSNKFEIQIIWDDMENKFYAGVIGDTKATMYNIKGKYIIDDPIHLIALKYFDYDDEELYKKTVKKYLRQEIIYGQNVSCWRNLLYWR